MNITTSIGADVSDGSATIDTIVAIGVIEMLASQAFFGIVFCVFHIYNLFLFSLLAKRKFLPFNR